MNKHGRKDIRVCGKRTICEVHRQLYDLLVIGLSGKDEKLLENATELLSEVFDMGIEMTKKLVEYKLSLPKWDKVKDRKEVSRLRALRDSLVNKKLVG